MTTSQQFGPYLLMTAAYNEEAYIERTIQSVVGQTVLPRKWIIVSDNSNDRTDEIVKSYCERFDFIELLHITRESTRHNFGAKVLALRKGEELLRGLDYEFMGNLDADVTLETTYFEQLIRQFIANPELGIASGFVHEDDGTGFKSRWFNSTGNVPHAAQLVRRACYEEIGGYAVLKYGGEDWYAQTCAKMNGWRVESFPALKVFHHRQTGGGAHPLRNAFRLGRMDYSFGSDLLFEMVKCAKKFRDKPLFIAAITRFIGFAWSSLSGEDTAVPQEFASYLRAEQRARVSALFTRSSFSGVSDNRNRQVQ